MDARLFQRRVETENKLRSTHFLSARIVVPAMGAALSTRRTTPCLGLESSETWGICVATKHGVYTLANWMTQQLDMYSLINGAVVRSIGSRGNGKGQFSFGYGGLCVTPDGDSILVADKHNNRVQEVRIADGSWVRFVGMGVVKEPQYVDCNADVIAASQPGYHRISVLSWTDGSVRAQLGGGGSGRLRYPCGVRLLADGSGLVVADSSNDRLCVFTPHGDFLTALGNRDEGLDVPYSVLELDYTDSFVVANTCNSGWIRISRDGAQVSKLTFVNHCTALAALPNDGGFVVVKENPRVQQLVHRRARLAWMRACLCLM
jgi:hypothetical protein